MNFNYLVRYDEFLFYPRRECQLAPDFRRVKRVLLHMLDKLCVITLISGGQVLEILHGDHLAI